MEGEHAGEHAKSEIDKGIAENLKLRVKGVRREGDHVKAVQACFVVDGQKAGKEQGAAGEQKDH